MFIFGLTRTGVGAYVRSSLRKEWEPLSGAVCAKSGNIECSGKRRTTIKQKTRGYYEVTLRQAGKGIFKYHMLWFRVKDWALMVKMLGSANPNPKHCPKPGPKFT